MYNHNIILHLLYRVIKFKKYLYYNDIKSIMKKS